MLHQALEIADGPVAIRWPKTAARRRATTGSGLAGRRIIAGDGSVCFLGLGKLVEACEGAAALLAADGVRATVWDVRVASPLDERMLEDASRHALVVTAEDGVADGGVGAAIAGRLRSLHAADVPGRSRRTGDGVAGGSPAAWHRPEIVTCGLPLAFLAHGGADDILAAHGLDAAGLAAAARRSSAVAAARR